MTLHDFRPRWRIGRRSACLTSGAMQHAIDVLSGVSLRVHSLHRRARSECASVPHFARHRLRHLTRIALHAVAHLHMHNDMHSNVQTTCPERAMPAACLAFADWPVALCAAPAGHRLPVPPGRGKMQGKIKGRGTPLRAKPVCTWGWRGTRLIAAPCRVKSQRPVGIEESTCPTRWIATALDGASA